MRTAGKSSAAWVAAAALALLASDAGGNPERDDVVTLDVDTATVSGFRMEGAPEVEVVFGDAKRYQRYVDAFYRHEEAMAAARGFFYRNVQSSIAVLATTDRRAPCPTESLAPLYYRARTSLERYRRAGADFEGEYLAIVQLDGLGETAALTPDYRWRVHRVRGVYQKALVDFREMRAALANQLGPELRQRRCAEDSLMTLGRELVGDDPSLDDALSPGGPPASGITRQLRDRERAPLVAAAQVTFFVDNRSCPGPMTVYVDGDRLGDVPAGVKAAFQASAGHHTMCILPDGAPQACGEIGTLRSSFVYDGWAMTMHCMGPE